MANNDDLFMAILAMDAYSRAYGDGIEDGVTMISRCSERPKTPSKEITGRAVRHCRLRCEA
jgi:hypothetical protein